MVTQFFSVLIPVVIGMLWIVWRATRNMRNGLSRALVRSLCAAFLVTPTIVREGGYPGDCLLPSALALLLGLIPDDQQIIWIYYGLTPLLVSLTATGLLVLTVAVVRPNAYQSKAIVPAVVVEVSQ